MGDPIYDFRVLKRRLADMGIVLGEAAPWRSVGTVDVFPEDIDRRRIIFEDNGIFYIDDTGIKRRGFMYKARFFFEYQGRINQPKFHVCNCPAINDFGQNAYRFANAEPITIYSRNANREVEVEGMELCGYCRNILMHEEAERVRNSTDFVQILQEAGEVEEPTESNIDIFGYVRDWEQISLAYRTKMNFTCERCGTHVADGFDHFYMQTHHRNGIKTDNHETNFECLCVYCHSQVDDVHRRNFSSRAQRLILEEYLRKYPIRRT